jgi:hypothetical protein
MGLRCTTEPDGRLTIRQRSDLIAVLFGLPFLAIGAWLLWQIPSGVIAYVRADAVSQLPGQIFGFFFLLIFATLFGVPGLLLVFGSKRVAIDPVRREVKEFVNWVVYRKSTLHALADFENVDVRHERRRGARVFLYNVYLAAANGRDHLLLGIEDRCEPALELARTAARCASLPVRDRTDEVAEE